MIFVKQNEARLLYNAFASVTHKPHQCLFRNLHLFVANSFWQDMSSQEDLSDYNEVFQVSIYLFHVRCEPPLAYVTK